ncbi:BMP family ABC transporter substrate-binding protein [Clostridia bacterium]|nr:BMP family ABC transporter substrate-binding protein [Clostridia bacterium]
MRIYHKLIAVFVCFFLVLSISGCANNQPEEPAEDVSEEPTEALVADGEDQVKVGFIFLGPVGDAGWSYAHDQGRKYVEEKMPNVETVYVENVPDSSDSERVMTELIEEGCVAIFATSFGYMDFMMNVAEKNPDVAFFHCSGYKTADNMSTYYARMYQASYLTGLTAGGMTETNEIGFVAAHPIPIVIQEINAFAIGVREANPDAVVKVVWTNTWFDPAKEKDAAKSLLDAGADVIAQHQDTYGPQQAAEEAGAYSIGFNADMCEYAPHANLTSAVWNWGPYYVSAVSSVLDGSFECGDYWGGLEDGIVDIAPMNDVVDSEIVSLVETRKSEIMDGTFDVFAGPIKNQDGEIVVPAGESIQDSDINSMLWFVEGIEGVIPE